MREYQLSILDQDTSLQVKALKDFALNVSEAAARIKVSKTTIYKALNIKESYM